MSTPYVLEAGSTMPAKSSDRRTALVIPPVTSAGSAGMSTLVHRSMIIPMRFFFSAGRSAGSASTKPPSARPVIWRNSSYASSTVPAPMMT